MLRGFDLILSPNLLYSLLVYILSLTVYQKGNVLIIGDLMHAFAIQVNHPEINANFDGDKDNAASSRKSILQYAKDNGLTMCGMHLPVPEK